MNICIKPKNDKALRKSGKKYKSYKLSEYELFENIFKEYEEKHLIKKVFPENFVYLSPEQEAELNIKYELFDKRNDAVIEKYRIASEYNIELDTELIKKQLFYSGEMVGIKEIVEILGKVVTESAVKQACQQERLLNTKKVGKSWLVNIAECRAYWNVPDNDERHLYYDWTY